MAYPPRPTSPYSFTIAIFCALTIEADAVGALFDVCWDDDNGPPFEKAPNDHNTYSTGVIGRHNVVLAHVPGVGTTSAASIASHCKSSFPNIKLGLVVGICGVVPFSAEGEIVLGDVIVSDGVVQYDFGRRLPGGFERKNGLRDSLGRPNPMIRSKLTKLKGLRSRKKLNSQLAKHLSTLQQEQRLSAGYPGKAHDKLFEATYHHVDQDRTCEDIGCYGSLVQRQRLKDDQSDPAPFVHFGLFASGNTVMKFGEDRDSIANKEGIIAFEMVSAGVWDSFPCMVIKGACNYADSHNNKRWQRYAAATAAACMKGILAEWEPFKGMCKTGHRLEHELIVSVMLPEGTQHQPVRYCIHSIFLQLKVLGLI